MISLVSCILFSTVPYDDQGDNRKEVDLILYGRTYRKCNEPPGNKIVRTENGGNCDVEEVDRCRKYSLTHNRRRCRFLDVRTGYKCWNLILWIIEVEEELIYLKYSRFPSVHLPVSRISKQLNVTILLGTEMKKSRLQKCCLPQAWYCLLYTSRCV